jgi:hypothetical protein
MSVYEYIDSKKYVNGKKVEDKDVKMILKKGIMNVDINDNGKKEHYRVNLNKNNLLRNLHSPSYDYSLQDRLKRDFMRERQEFFSPSPLNNMEIIVLPKKKSHTKRKSKKLKKSKKSKIYKQKKNKSKKVKNN